MIMALGSWCRRLVISASFAVSGIYAQELLDLETMTQPFVVETQQIHIPGFYGAFNGSLIRWQGSLLLSFRVRNAQLASTFEIGCVFLDDNFNPISTPSIVGIRGHNPSTFAQNQDPRLIVLNDQLYILYSNFIQLGDIVSRRMFIASLVYDDGCFFIDNPLCLHSFAGSGQRWEKNWVPFIYNDQLLLAYSLYPHRVLKPIFETGVCEDVYTTRAQIAWEWGDLRGGTPAIREGDEYIAFFHSSTYIATVHSQGKKIQHYLMGAYTFSAHPPFALTRISSKPIVGKQFYHGQEYQTWKNLRVVFPMSCLNEKDHFWVTYGRQDHEIWVAKIDKQGLYDSLVPCPEGISKQFFGYNRDHRYDREVCSVDITIAVDITLTEDDTRDS